MEAGLSFLFTEDFTVLVGDCFEYGRIRNFDIFKMEDFVYRAMGRLVRLPSSS